MITSPYMRSKTRGTMAAIMVMIFQLNDVRVTLCLSDVNVSLG